MLNGYKQINNSTFISSELTLFNLQMITLPNSIGKLVNLQELDLRMNMKLQILPDSIVGLVKLEHLLLGHCTGLITRISGLPSLIRLHSLEELNLDYCIGLDRLPELPTNLVKLSVTGVSLLSIPDFSCLTNLTELRLVLKARENDSSALTEIRCFSISSIGTLSKLKFLNLSLPGFTVKETSKFINLIKLESLHLMCSEMEICAFSFPSRLRGLDMSLKKGTTSLSLTGLNRLTSLKLSDCGDLAEIPGMGELESLSLLGITRCNSLEKLDDSISKLRQLTFLKIRECQKLRDISSGFNNLSLEYLEIQGCPLLEDKSRNELKVMTAYIDRKPAIVDNASPWPSPSNLPVNHPLPTTKDEAQHSESHRDLDNEFVQTLSDEVAERTTTDQMKTRDFYMDMSSSSTFSTDDPSLEMDDLAIHEQLLSLLDDDEAIIM